MIKKLLPCIILLSMHTNTYPIIAIARQFLSSITSTASSNIAAQEGYTRYYANNTEQELVEQELEACKKHLATIIGQNENHRDLDIVLHRDPNAVHLSGSTLLVGRNIAQQWVNQEHNSRTLHLMGLIDRHQNYYYEKRNISIALADATIWTTLWRRTSNWASQTRSRAAVIFAAGFGISCGVTGSLRTMWGRYYSR